MQEIVGNNFGEPPGQMRMQKIVGSNFCESWKGLHFNKPTFQECQNLLSDIVIKTFADAWSSFLVSAGLGEWR